MSKLDKVKEAIKKFDEAKEKMLEETKKNFSDCARDLFIEHPVLKGFSWTQYTPYFNDGDTCEFSAHIDYPNITFYSDPEKELSDYQLLLKIRSIADLLRDSSYKNAVIEAIEEPIDDEAAEDEEEDSEFLRWEAEKKLKNNIELTPEEKAGLAVCEFLRLFNVEFFQDMFGDGVKVRVTANGVNVQEYEHE